MKHNITQYSDNELSLQVFNTESLYLERHNPGFIQLIIEMFEFNQKQMDILINDILIDKEDDDE